MLVNRSSTQLQREFLVGLVGNERILEREDLCGNLGGERRGHRGIDGDEQFVEFRYRILNELLVVRDELLQRAEQRSTLFFGALLCLCDRRVQLHIKTIVEKRTSLICFCVCCSRS